MGFKKDYNRYKELLKDYRPTIRSFLFSIFLKKFVEKNRHKEDINNPDMSFNTRFLFPENLVYIALVQNDTVQEMIRIDAKTAELLISKETSFVFFDKDSTIVKPGMKYKNGKFFEIDSGV